MGKMARSSDYRKTGDCNSLAEKTFQKALDQDIIQKETRQEENKEGNPRSYFQNGRRKPLGSSENLFRTLDVGF